MDRPLDCVSKTTERTIMRDSIISIECAVLPSRHTKAVDRRELDTILPRLHGAEGRTETADSFADLCFVGAGHREA